MVTTVTIPKEKLEPRPFAAITDEPELLGTSRPMVDRIRDFVEDRSRDELMGWNAQPGAQPGPAPEVSEEIIDQMIQSGVGTSGIFTVVEPADLDLYRSYLQPPLTMPEKPEVSVMLVDFNGGNPATRYQEGWVFIRVGCPDGVESRLVISMPVPTMVMLYMGVAWGLPKYIADEMTVTPTKAEVIYEGKVRLGLDLTPGSVEDEEAMMARVRAGTGPLVMFHPTTYGNCPIRMTGRGGKPPKYVDVQTGMVKAYMRPEDRWASLIPADSVTPGLYQRIVPPPMMLGGENVIQKVKG